MNKPEEKINNKLKAKMPKNREHDDSNYKKMTITYDSVYEHNHSAVELPLDKDHSPHQQIIQNKKPRM